MTQQVEFWVNGQAAQHISLQDRAVQYGDGFFTTILVVDNRLLNWNAHWLRIEQSCQALALPSVELEKLSIWIDKALTAYFAENKVTDCVLKIEFTRGEGGVGYQAPDEIHSNCLFYIKPSPITVLDDELSATAAMSVGLCKTQAGIGSFAGIKSLNRLENVMARTEMANLGYVEGLMLNANDQVVCGTQSNFYLIKGDTIYTPKIAISGVRGTTRHQLNHLLEDSSWSLIEQEISLRDVEQADELFFTNAVRGIQPVKQFLNIQYGSEQTHKIHQAWSNWQLENGVSASNIKTDSNSFSNR